MNGDNGAGDGKSGGGKTAITNKALDVPFAELNGAHARRARATTTCFAAQAGAHSHNTTRARTHARTGHGKVRSTRITYTRTHARTHARTGHGKVRSTRITYTRTHARTHRRNYAVEITP